MNMRNTFDVIAEMVHSDIENQTQLVKVGPHIISIEIKGGNGFVTMGVDAATAMDIMDKKNTLALLLVVDKAELRKRTNQ